jgi:membrane-bound ClpP family serine protease
LVLLTAAVGALAYQGFRAMRAPSPTGREGLVGARGRALTTIDASGGFAKVHAERWRSTSESPIDADAAIRVVSVDERTLRVVAESKAPSKKEEVSS